MAAIPETVGVVLAGGRSSRMGGRDKAELDLSGKPLIAHAAQRLAGQCAAVILNANGDGARFADLGFPVVADSFPDYRGPLAGILAGLDWMAGNRPSAQWLVSIAVDTPFFPGDFVARLHAAREEADTPLAMAQSGERHHPVNTLWSAALRDALRATLAANPSCKVGAWIRERGVAVASWDTDPFDPFLNINTPEDFEAARLLKYDKFARHTA